MIQEFLLHTYRRVLKAGALIVLFSCLVPASAWTQTSASPADTGRQIERMERALRDAKEDPESEMRGENLRAREEWFFLQRAYPYDVIPEGARAAAVREIQNAEARLKQSRKQGSTLMSTSTWTNIGPANVGGRIRAVAIDPTDSRTIFVGAAAGGVWKTTDGGESWSTTFDHQSALAMGALAIDPSNHLTVYAGTGEDMPNSTSYTGDGIFKSTDGGATWNQSGLTQVGAFSRLRVHRQHPNILYAAGSRTAGGFYRSTDAGATWTRTYSGDVYEAAVNPANSDTVIIATSAAVYRSNDAGLTFTRITTGSGGIDPGGVDHISIAYAPSDARRLYLLLSRVETSLSGEDGEIYKSTDGGVTWRLSQKFNDAWFFFGQGIYNNAIAVDPTNPDVALALGIDIYQTADGGNSWSNITRVYQAGFDIETAHPDQHVAIFDPRTPGLVYVANDGGLYRSNDRGNNWERISARLPISQFYNIDVDPINPLRVYGGTQDDGSAGSIDVTAANLTEPWTSIAPGDGFFTPVDHNSPNLVYAENYGGTPIMRIDIENGYIQYLQTEFPSDDAGAWSTPMAVSPIDGSTLYTGRHNLWRTANMGNDWEKLTLPNGQAISAFDLSPFADGTIIVAKGGGGVYLTTDDGGSWKTATGLPNRFVTSTVFDPVSASRVYVTFSGYGAHHIYRSENGGVSFSDISTQLPDIPVNSIAIDPLNGRHLFVGTDAGAFVSLDDGATWLPFNDGLPLCPVLTLKIHKDSRTLYAGTFGRSIFSVSIADPEGEPLVIYPAGGETIVTPLSLPIRWAGFESAVRVLLSHDAGATYDTVAAQTTGSSVSVALGVQRSDNMRVRVEEIGTGRNAVSGIFSLTASANASEITGRGFQAEALVVRKDYLWATSRGSDTIYRLKLPFLQGKESVIRHGITGTIRDLAYDASTDQFFALVTDADFTNPHIIRLDTVGTALGELPAPAAALSGIEMAPQGLALITPGATGRIIIIDPADGSMISRSDPLSGATGNDRHALTWDGLGLVQGVVDAEPAVSLASELQRLLLAPQPSVTKSLKIIKSTSGPVTLFGLAFGALSADQSSKTFYLTDTAGKIYQIMMSDPVSGIREIAGGSGSAGTRIEEIIPQPLRDAGRIRIHARVQEKLKLTLWSPEGTHIADMYEGIVAAGTSEIPVALGSCSSGIYYVTLTTASGERSTRPICIVK